MCEVKTTSNTEKQGAGKSVIDVKEYEWQKETNTLLKDVKLYYKAAVIKTAQY